MNFTESLRNNLDFSKVYKNGKSFANRFFVMYILENNTSCNRLGISVSKKVGNSVVRHRIKRLVKESYRLQENMFISGIDIVVIARGSASSVSFTETDSALRHLAKLHKIMK